MFKTLFFLFIIIPILEIMLLMNVGSLIGVLPTITIVIVTAWLGATMVRQQGLATFQSVQTKLNNGEMPSDEIIAAVLLLIAGVLLLTPGFITDGFGLLLLWPVSRRGIVAFLKKHLVLNQVGSGGFYQGGFGQSNHFEGEFERKDDPFESMGNSLNHQDKADNKSTIDVDFERKD